MTPRTVLFSKITTLQITPKVKHYWGLPAELSENGTPQTLMPQATMLLIEEEDGEDSDGVFLLRFTTNGKVVGDTWHQSIDEAKEQAEFEFESGLSNWITVPDNESDPLTYGLRTFNDT